MLIDCHAHTARYSACSRIAPDRLGALAVERGLSGLVITEHRIQWSRAELDALETRSPGLKLYGGVELTLKEGYDVVVVTGERLDAPWPLGLRQLTELLEDRRERVFVFVAHPFRYSQRLDGPIRDILAWVDGVEMNSTNILKAGGLCGEDGLYRPCNHDVYERARREHSLAPLYNSDSHRTSDVGSVATWLDVPAPPRDEIELAAALRSAQREERQDKELVRKLVS